MFRAPDHSCCAGAWLITGLPRRFSPTLAWTVPVLDGAIAAIWVAESTENEVAVDPNRTVPGVVKHRGLT